MDDVEAFLLARCGFKASTIQEQRRHYKALHRYGFRLAEFLRSPKAAEAVAERVMVAAKMDGRPANTLRNMGKVVNRCLLYAKHRDQRFKGLAPWRLEDAPRPRKDRFTPDEVAALRGYRHASPWIMRRRRAMLSISEHTGLRRSEIARLGRPDLAFYEGRWWLKVTPAKGGDRRSVPMPTDDVDPRLAEWLDLRDSVVAVTAGLWASPHGRAITPEVAGQEFWYIAQDLGFGVSFTKARRTFAKRLRAYNIHDSIGMHALGQSSPKVFQGYAGAVADQDLPQAYHAAGLPGY